MQKPGATVDSITQRTPDENKNEYDCFDKSTRLNKDSCENSLVINLFKSNFLFPIVSVNSFYSGNPNLTYV